MYLHTGMPHTCEDCGKQFQTEHKLREVHIKKHHPERYQQLKIALNLQKMSEDQTNLSNIRNPMEGIT